jgi:hypothetical protein
MTGASGRGISRIRHGLGRALACVLAVVVVACWTSDNRGVTPPSGVIGITPGGSTGTGSGNFAGFYTLQTLRDTIVPAVIFYDSTLGVDDTVFAVSFDSSFISLNTDTSASEIDFLTIRDIRTDADSDVNRTESFVDTTLGNYSASGQNVTLTLIDTVGGAHTVTTNYAVSITTSQMLTGKITYSLYNTAGLFEATDTSTAVYALSGLPDHDVSSQSISSRSRSQAGPLGPRRFRPPLGARSATGAAMPARTWRAPASLAARLAATRARIRP